MQDPQLAMAKLQFSTYRCKPRPSRSQSPNAGANQRGPRCGPIFRSLIDSMSPMVLLRSDLPVPLEHSSYGRTPVMRGSFGQVGVSGIGRYVAYTPITIRSKSYDNNTRTTHQYVNKGSVLYESCSSGRYSKTCQNPRSESITLPIGFTRFRASSCAEGSVRTPRKTASDNIH